MHSEELKKVDKALKSIAGVHRHGLKFRVSFTFQGERRHEPLENIKLTVENALKAGELVKLIKSKIKLGSFDYAAHFPNSKFIERKQKSAPTNAVKTVAFFIKAAMKLKKAKVKDISHDENRINLYILPELGNMPIDKVKYSDIESWRSIRLDEIYSEKELNRLKRKAKKEKRALEEVAGPNHALENLNEDEPIIRLGAKTKNNILTPLRDAFKLAYYDEKIDRNPMDMINNLHTSTNNIANPFTLAEIAIISKKDTFWESERNGVVFACWSGLRVSEWLALAWEDIDFDNNLIHVKRCVVKGQYSQPKTPESNRSVTLLKEAKQVLLAQKELIPIPLKTTIRLFKNDKSFTKETISFIFVNSLHHEAWPGGHNINKMFFKDHLKQCKIEIRGVNQARHTYGSMMVTKGLPLKWVSDEMGHTTVKMVEKHYAKWIRSNTPKMSVYVSSLFENDPNHDPNTPIFYNQLKL